MLRVITILAMAAPAMWGHDTNVSTRSPVTLILEYEAPPAPESIAEMKRELDDILKRTNLRVEWKLRSEMKLGDNVADLAMIKLRGNCRMETMPVVFDERGPLAFAHTSEGEILPFTEVICDRVRVVARSAMFGGDFARADQLLGRALARVVAHELYHMVGGSHDHDKDGVTRHALSGKQLIADKLNLSSKSASRLQRALAPRP